MKQYLDYVLDGRPVEVEATRREEWEARNPAAERAQLFLLPDGSQTLVRESRRAAFDAEAGAGGAEVLHRLDGDDGKPYRVRASRLRDWTREHVGGGGGSVALAGAKGAAGGLWQGVKDVPKAVGEMGMALGSAAADIATAAPRVTGHVAGAVAEHLPEGGVKDYLEGVRDAGRGPVGTLGGLADALRAPLTDNAGTRHVARPLMDLGATIGKFAVLGPAAALVMGAEGAAGAMDRAVANGKSETRAVLAGAPAGAAEAFVFSGANPTARLAANAFRPAAAATVRGAQARTIAGAALRGAVQGAESETAKGLAAGDLSAEGVARAAGEMALVSGAHTGLETFGRFQDAARAEREGREAARAEAAARARERNAGLEEARSAMEERTIREGEDPALYDRIAEEARRAAAAEEAAPPRLAPEQMAEAAPPRLAPEQMAEAAPPRLAPEQMAEPAPPRLAPEAMAGADAATNAKGDAARRQLAEYGRRFGNVISGDNARAMLGADPARPETHAGFARDVNRIVSGVFDRAVREIRRRKGGTVVFTGGGNGAGKSTVVEGFANADAIFDSTMTAAAPTREKIDAVLKAGGSPSLVFVYRDPLDAWRGVQARMQAGGHGVTPESFANSHVKARETFLLLAKEFGDSIDTVVYENDGKTPPRRITLDELAQKPSYTKEQLHELIKKQNGQGGPGSVHEETERPRAVESPEGAGALSGAAAAEASPAPVGELAPSPQQGPPAAAAGAEGGPRADPSTGGAAFASPIPRGVFDSAIAEASAAVRNIRERGAAPASPSERLSALLARDAKAGPALPDAAKAEYRALAEGAAASGLYRTAARARARIGEMKGMPAESRAGAEGPDAAVRSGAAATPEARRLFAEAEGGAPQMQRLGVGELVGMARQLLGGQLPGVRRILKGGFAAGLFRPGEAAAARFGMHDAGRRRAIEILGKLYQVLPEGERARIEADAARAARVETGAEKGEAFEAARGRWHGKLFEEAWHRSLKDGPQAAARTLAHEIGHLVDFLPGRSADDHALRRGNILGHIAGLSRYMKDRLAFSPDAHFTAEREAGRETLRGEDALFPPKERAAVAKAAREAVARERGESVEAWQARRAKAGKEAVAEEGLRRGLAGRPEVVKELHDLVAWYNTSDGCPEYYARNAAELFAESFGAAVNYPEIARVKAPRFMKLMDGWIEANPEAARSLAAARRRAGALEAKAIRTGRSQPDEPFFGELRSVTAAQTEARRRIGEILRAEGRQTVEEANDFMRAWFIGRFEPVWKRIRRHGGWTREESAKAWGSLNRLSHWANGGDIMAYRWRSEVAPLVAKVKGGQDAFDEFLINWRVANEALGENRTGGRVNLANPLGLTPGDFTGPGAEYGRTAAARLKSIAERDPEQWSALLAAREAFWKMRTDRESSVLPMLRRSGLMPERVLAQLEANSAYVRFRRGVTARDYGPRELSKVNGAEMSTWSGVFRQVSGMHDAVESPTLATLLGDMEIYRRAALNEARRDVANFLMKELPGEVRPSTAFRFERGRGVVPVQTEDAHRRTLVWMEDGRPKALEVPKAVADALGDDAIGLGLERSAALVQGIRAFARCESALMTAWNYSFAAKNVLRDKADMARAMPGRSWDTTGGVLANVLGDFGAAARAAANGAGRNRRLGISDERVLRALETGAMPAGSGTAWASGKRFAEQIGDLLSSDSAADRESAVRSIMEAAGFDPSLAKEDGALKRAAAWLGKWYQKPLEKLSDQETNNKVQAMLEIRAEHPDWSPDRVAWYVQRYIGTPDPTDRPRVAEYPLFNLFVPFWTMNVHGNHDQLVRLAAEPGQAGIQAARYVAHASLKWATNFSGPALQAWARKRRAEGDADAAALAEEVAAMQRAIPVADRLGGFCLPLVWADKASGKVWYLRIPSGQSISVLDALFLGSSARSQGQTTGSEVFDASLGQLLPRPGGPVWNAAHGAMLGVDVDRGFREISGDGASELEAGLDRAAYVLRALTVSGAGLLPRQGKMPWSAPDAGETVEGLERALRAPGLNAALGSFLRCSNGGLRAEARIVNAEERARSARAKRAAERIIARKADADDWRALYESAADPSRTLKNASKRANAPAADPLSSALEKVPERFRADAEERHGRR